MLSAPSPHKLDISGEPLAQRPSGAGSGGRGAPSCGPAEQRGRARRLQPTLRGNPGVLAPSSPCPPPLPAHPCRWCPMGAPQAPSPAGPVAKGPLLRTNIRVPPCACAMLPSDHVTRIIWRRPWGGVRGGERSLLGVCRCHVATYCEESPQWGEAPCRVGGVLALGWV